MYCPFPWSQSSHNSSSFLRIAFLLGQCPCRRCEAKIGGDVGALQHVRRLILHSLFLETTAAFCSSKICIFLTGNTFSRTKTRDRCLLLAPFSVFSLHRGCTEASNWGGAIQSNPHCGISVRPPRQFYVFFIIAPPTTISCP